MRKYITKISLEDFKALHPEIANNLVGTFPYCVAISKKEYPVLNDAGTAKTLWISNVRHIYSTRDYWEVFNHRESKFKIPKKLTRVIYQVEAE